MKPTIKRSALFYIATASCVLLTGCMIEPTILEIDASTEQNDDDSEKLRVDVLTTENLRALSADSNLDIVGSLHICGYETTYSTPSYLRDVKVQNKSNSYSFYYENTFADQVVTAKSGGRISLGWPHEIVEQNGVCFQLRSGRIGYYLRSNIVKIENARSVFNQD